MTRDEYDALVDGMSRSPIYKTIMREFTTRGPLSSPQLRAPTGRSDGLTTELHRLMKLGLIREVGPDTSATTTLKPMRYEAVSPEDVEKAAALDKERRAAASRKRKRGSVKARLASLPKREAGDRLRALTLRRRTLQVTEAFQVGVRAAYWSELTDDDLFSLADDAAWALDVLVELAAELEKRVADDALLDRIQKLRGTAGRTAAEMRAADGLIAKINRRRVVQGEVEDMDRRTG
jgi:hypothetical protein